MSSKKISEFELANTLAGNDEFLLIDASASGAPTKTTLSNLDQVLVRQPSTGLSGQKGEPGIPGQTGSPGPIGELGEIGLQGSLGERGADGDEGASGSHGSPGLRGQVGLHGTTGNPGIPGQRGPQGPIGQKGYATTYDVVGHRGNKGNKGLPGQDGSPGPKGQLGIPGLPVVGRTGHRGDVGEILLGPKGLPGPSGPTAVPGQTGDPGESGAPYIYTNSPRRTLRLPDGKFSHARYLFEVSSTPTDVYSYEWESDLADHTLEDASLHRRRFLIFQLEDTNFTNFSYSKYFVEVDFEPFIVSQHSPVLSKVTLAAYHDDVTYGTVGLDWCKDTDGKHHVMFFSVSANGHNDPIKIKKIFTHYGSVKLGTENLENFRI
jgi:hypothetical protein